VADAFCAPVRAAVGISGGSASCVEGAMIARRRNCCSLIGTGKAGTLGRGGDLDRRHGSRSETLVTKRPVWSTMVYPGRAAVAVEIGLVFVQAKYAY
jgi:hypothetical protein